MWRHIQAWLAQRHILSQIRQHGWTGTYVPVGDIGFAYTTGFQDSVSSPELIMFGIFREQGRDLSRDIYDDLKMGAFTLEDGARWPPDEPRGVAVRAVHPTQMRREHFNVAIWRWKQQGRELSELKAVQLVFPDTNGVFPWEPGYDTDYRPRQAALYEPYVGPPDEY